MSQTLVTHSGLAVAGTFTLYLLVMFAIGYWAWRRTKDSADYYLGGRSLSPWPAALSAGASDMSGWLLLGLPGFAYAAGLESLWLVLGLLLGTWANWRFLAAKLRRDTQAYGNALTLPEYFSNRFADHKRILQAVSAVFILLFFLFYTSAGLVAGGKLFNSVFGFDYHWAVLIGCLCVVSYTFFGGFLAVAWTDLVQGLLMAAALVVVPLFAWQVASDHALVDSIYSANRELLNPLTDASGQPLTVIAVVSLLAWGLGYFGQPHILARFAAIRSEQEVPKARRIAVSWTAISMAAAVAVGLVGFSVTQAAPLADAETIFIYLVNSLFHPLPAGILLAAILAAIMSTADSQLLVSSSALAEDIYRRFMHKQASDHQILWVSRLSVVCIAGLATFLAMTPDSSVLGLVSYAWAGFGAAFGPALLFSVYWMKTSCWGVLAGMLTGAITVIIWGQISGGIFDLYELVPGFMLACLAIVVGSRLKPGC